MMTSKTIDQLHQEMVLELVKDPQAIQESLTPLKIDLWHMATGVAGEGGELLDQVKKHVVYNKPLDLDNMIEELGDLEFYMRKIRHAIGVMRDEVLEKSMAKLGVRYAGGYTDAAAQARVDKEEGQ